MKSTELTLWISELSTDPDRRQALVEGRNLIGRAVEERKIDGTDAGWESLAQAFAQAYEDGWLTCTYEKWPGDSQMPVAFAFRYHHLQRCRDIRLTRDGWQVIGPLRHAGQATAVEPQSALPVSKPKDIFISHATEDKDEVARPIAERLEETGWEVWFDEFELQIGDSLRRRIDDGLAQCRFGAVILSPHFLGRKQWTEHELDGLMTRQVSDGTTVILPIWHEVEFDDVAKYSPSLAGQVATRTSKGLGVVVADLDIVLRRDGGPDRRGGVLGAPFQASDAASPAPTSTSSLEEAIASSRERKAAEAEAVIDETAELATELPAIAREALFQYFHDRQPLTVGGSHDRYSMTDGKWADEHGYLVWSDDQPQALTVRHDQPEIEECEVALGTVRRTVFDGSPFIGVAKAGEWARPFLNERYGVSDPTFELRPVWEALRFL
jgi:TIR domain